MNKIAKIVLISLATAMLIANSSYATLMECVGENGKYPGLSTLRSDAYPVKCTRVKDEKGKYQTLYGKSQADCAQAGTIAADIEAACGMASSYSDDYDTDDYSKLFNSILGQMTEDNSSKTREETEKKEEAPILLIISLAANGVLAIAVIILIIVLVSKNKSDSPQANMVAQTTQTTATPTTPVKQTAPQTPETPQNFTTMQ